MTKETRELFEKIDEDLYIAYKNVRIVISELKDEDISEGLIYANMRIDEAKQEIEKLLGSVSNVEIFRLTTDDKSVVFSEANHV